MAELTELHKGSFTDYDGNTIIVTFYHSVDINAYPESLWIDASGGTLELSIWSKDGEASLGDPQEDWWNYRQKNVERIPGTRWHKYTYYIDVDENPATPRSTELNIFNDDGAAAAMTVTLKQGGQA